MIWAAELDRYVTYICEEWSAVTGQPPSESLDLGWSKAVRPEERDMICGAFLQAFEHRCTFTLRYRLRRYTGDHMWETGAAAPFVRPERRGVHRLSRHRQQAGEREAADGGGNL